MFHGGGNFIRQKIAENLHRQTEPAQFDRFACGGGPEHGRSVVADDRSDPLNSQTVGIGFQYRSQGTGADMVTDAPDIVGQCIEINIKSHS